MMLLTGVDGVSCLCILYLTFNASDRTEFALFVYLKFKEVINILYRYQNNWNIYPDLSISHIIMCVRFLMS